MMSPSFFLVLAGIPNLTAGQPVKRAGDVFRYQEFWALFMNQLQCIAIAAYFLLVTVAQMRLAENDGENACLIYCHAFNTVGRNGAFDQRMFAQRLKALGRLFGKSSCLPRASDKSARYQDVAEGMVSGFAANCLRVIISSSHIAASSALLSYSGNTPVER